MESVATIVETSDLFCDMFLLLEVSSGVAEDLALVFGVSEAHVVVEVSNQLFLVDIVLLIKVCALLLKSLKHSLVVGCGIEQALIQHLLSILESGN